MFRSLHEAGAAAKNLLLLAYVFARREPRETWRANFSREEYIASYPDVLRWPYPPALHYLIFGNRDLRDPSPRFDTRFYLARNPDVERSGMNALAHFAAFGKREGRVLPAMFQGGADSASTPAVPVPNELWPATEPLVSIVIPCYNQGAFIEATLSSALVQTFTGIEIIVVEGGSTDGVTPAKIHDLEAANPDVRFLYRGERHFVGDNRNFGIAASRGRYICCLDSDDLLDPAYIEATVFLAEALGYGVVYSTVKRLGSSDVIWRVKDTTLGQIFFDNQIPVPGLFRCRDWELAGGYRDWGHGEGYVSEDWDFWIRIVGLGRSTRAIAEPLFAYRINDAGMTAQIRPVVEVTRQRIQEANAELFDHPPAAAPIIKVGQPFLNLGAPRDQGRSVLFALPFLTFGGAEALFRNVAEWAKEAGWTPLVITTLDRPEMPKDPDCFRGVTERVYSLATLFRSNEERLGFVQYLIQRYRVRVLVLGGSEAVYHWLPAIKAAHPDVAVVDHLFNSDTHIYNNHHYRKAIDATVVQSERVLDDIRRQLGEPAGEVRRIPLGVEIPDQQVPDEAGNEITIGYFGRLSPEKGPDLFVRIAKRLAAGHAGVPSLRFILAGDGPEKESVQKLVRGAESFIEMPGFVKEVSPLMRRADIVVLPSRIDGMPAAVLEAQALGIPVVASRVGGLPEMIVDGETGYLCAAEDVGMFCTRIEALIRDPDLRKRIGSAARRSVEEHHSIGLMKTRYLELLS